MNEITFEKIIQAAMCDYNEWDVTIGENKATFSLPYDNLVDELYFDEKLNKRVCETIPGARFVYRFKSFDYGEEVNDLFYLFIEHKGELKRICCSPSPLKSADLFFTVHHVHDLEHYIYDPNLKNILEEEINHFFDEIKNLNEFRLLYLLF